MIRLLALLGGLAGAVGLSQYPAFSAAYTQRLAGQVDELQRFVDNYSADAQASGLTTTQALAVVPEDTFSQLRQATANRDFSRYYTMNQSLTQLRAATPMQRLTMPHRHGDPATLAATWDDFEPSLPLSFAGVASAGVGFVAGWAGLATLLVALAMPFRRRRLHPVGQIRREPRLR